MWANLILASSAAFLASVGRTKHCGTKQGWYGPNTNAHIDESRIHRQRNKAQLGQFTEHRAGQDGLQLHLGLYYLDLVHQHLTTSVRQEGCKATEYLIILTRSKSRHQNSYSEGHQDTRKLNLFQNTSADSSTNNQNYGVNSLLARCNFSKGHPMNLLNGYERYEATLAGLKTTFKPVYCHISTLIFSLVLWLLPTGGYHYQHR